MRIILFLILCCSCSNSEEIILDESKIKPLKTVQIPFDSSITSIHILVALCDNENQGIVPVPKSIGNGQDPTSNLYWGAAYGIKTFFKKSKQWELIESSKVSESILERLVFKHKSRNAYLIADAYDGAQIKECTENFFRFSSGSRKSVISLDEKRIGLGGNANLIAYIGHNGLMDFDINEEFVSKDEGTKDIISLACYSKNYFEPHLAQAKTNALVWTTGFMAPEAYTIHDAITAYLSEKDNEGVSMAAAKAYSKYQKCSLGAARKLLVSN